MTRTEQAGVAMGNDQLDAVFAKILDRAREMKTRISADKEVIERARRAIQLLIESIKRGGHDA